ncbi:MAG: substrate-binding domain-containing protein, partial [Christensenellales bacterium]
QITKSEDIATAGYDVCLITPIDFEGVAGPLRTLRDAGVITVLVDSLAKDMSLADASSVSDNFQAGVLAGEACAKDLEEKYGEVKGKIAIFENTTSPPVRDRVAGFESVINTTNYPNIEIAIRENGKGQIDTGMDAMDNFLQAVPDLDAVFSMNDPSAQGCANAIEAAGKTGEIFVYGVDGSDASKEFIKAGKQNGSSAQFPITMGQEAVILSYKLLAGETLDNPHIKIPCEWIDASNVEQYITQK